MPPIAAAPKQKPLLLFAGLVLALLVGDSAAGFAGGLAGSLAFAATTVFRAFAKAAGIQCFDHLHGISLRRTPKKTGVYFFHIVAYRPRVVKRRGGQEESAVPLSPKQGERQKNRQKANIYPCEIPEIRSFHLACLPYQELVGNKACHGGNQCSKAAEIDTYN